MITSQEARDIQSIANDMNAVDNYKRNFDEAYNKRAELILKIGGRTQQQLTDLAALCLATLDASPDIPETDKQWLKAEYVPSIGGGKLTEYQQQILNYNAVMSQTITQFTQHKNNMDANAQYSAELKAEITAQLLDFDTRYNEAI